MKIISMLSVLFVGMSLIAAPYLAAGDDGDYQYQIQSATASNGTEFYFFRFEKQTGAVQLLKYDGEVGSGKPVSWRDLRDKKSPFTYIIYTD